jgi:hypothetical protein
MSSLGLNLDICLAIKKIHYPAEDLRGIKCNKIGDLAPPLILPNLS